MSAMVAWKALSDGGTCASLQCWELLCSLSSLSPFQAVGFEFLVKGESCARNYIHLKMQTPADTFSHSMRPGLSADSSKKPKAVVFFVLFPAGWS